MPTKQIECFYPVCGCHSECQSGSSTTTADQSQITETEMTDAEWNAVKRAILLPKWKQPTASDVAALRARVEARLAKN